MATEVFVTNCCAVIEVKNLSDSPDSKSAFNSICKGMYEGAAKFEKIGVPPSYGYPVYRLYNGSTWGDMIRPFLIFTGTVGPESRKVVGHPNQQRLYNYAEDFMAFIRENNLGDVSQSEAGVNFTRNLVKVYVWRPDWPEVYKLWEKMGGPAAPLEPDILDEDDDLYDEDDFDERDDDEREED